MEKWMPIFVSTFAVISVIGVSYYFKNDISDAKDKFMDTIDPDYDRYVGQKYFGGKTRRNRKNKYVKTKKSKH
jgi:hypothetical protein